MENCKSRIHRSVCKFIDDSTKDCEKYIRDEGIDICNILYYNNNKESPLHGLYGKHIYIELDGQNKELYQMAYTDIVDGNISFEHAKRSDNTVDVTLEFRCKNFLWRNKNV